MKGLQLRKAKTTLSAVAENGEPTTITKHADSDEVAQAA